MDKETVTTVTPEAPKTETTQTKDSDELSSLREQVQSLKDSLSQKIDELAQQRLQEKEISYRQRIEEAQRLVAEAEQNKLLEEELFKNEKYNKIDSWRENKEREFKEAVAKLADMGHQNMHMANFYKDYESYKVAAAKGDQRAKDKLGIMQLTYAAMQHGPDKLLQMLKSNIGMKV